MSELLNNISKEWKHELVDILGSEEFQRVLRSVEKEYSLLKICPPKEKIFNALNLCPPNRVRVVILGQDPYFNPNQAVGLAFSINPNCGCTFPPSLKNIITEIKNCFGECHVINGDLEPWARQGVLLLNTCLTVREGKCFSHKDIGWDIFINAIIERLNSIGNIIFVLWGSNAKRFEKIITNKTNYILKSAHPSPLSAHNGFFGCNHFMKINEILVKNGDEDIKW